MWNWKKITSIAILTLVWFLNFFFLYLMVTQSLAISDEIEMPKWIYDKEWLEKDFKEKQKAFGSLAAPNLQEGLNRGFVVFLLIPLIIFGIFIFHIFLKKSFSESANEDLKFTPKTPKFVKSAITMEIMETRNYYTWCFRTFEYLYFALSIAGIGLAIQYPKTGTFISIVSTFEQKVYEKIKSYSEEDKTALLTERIEQLELGIINRNTESEQQLQEIIIT